jgi:hypothetical protein
MMATTDRVNDAMPLGIEHSANDDLIKVANVLGRIDVDSDSWDLP